MEYSGKSEKVVVFLFALGILVSYRHQKLMFFAGTPSSGLLVVRRRARLLDFWFTINTYNSYHIIFLAQTPQSIIYPFVESKYQKYTGHLFRAVGITRKRAYTKLRSNYHEYTSTASEGQVHSFRF